MTRVVLGSASAGRLRVLRGAGIDPLVVVSGVDEDAIIARLSEADPADVVSALARAKAEAVAGDLDPAVAADAVVIGCDSMLYVGGRLCGKPGTPEQARRQWKSMAGTAGQLFTGHCVIRSLTGAPPRTAYTPLPVAPVPRAVAPPPQQAAVASSSTSSPKSSPSSSPVASRPAAPRAPASRPAAKATASEDASLHAEDLKPPTL